MRRQLFFLTSLFLMLFASVAFAQERTISGKVTDENGEPLPGATVQVKGDDTSGSVTDVEGMYKINVPTGATHLVIKFVGMDDKEVEIGAQSTIDVVMQSGKVLTEVVVVGYGEQSDKLSIQNVETISTDRFENMPVTTPQEILQGQAAGVQMVGSSGVIGARPNVRVRGVASITAGSQPLYVIDGVPMADGNGNTAYSAAQGGTSLNPLIELNPNDIESISVLKDAAATAIYGSRGANGVILITTKKGKRGEKTSFNFDTYAGVIEANAVREMMDADQYRQYTEELFQGALGGSAGQLPQESFDWVDNVLQTGSINSYNLSASGGSQKTQFYVGGSYLKQKGYILRNELEKLNARVNITHHASDKLRFGTNLSMAKTENLRSYADNSTFAPLTTALLQLPWNVPVDENGQFIRMGFPGNVLAVQELSDNRSITRRTTGNFFAEYDLIDGLTLKTDWGIDQLQLDAIQRLPDAVQAGGYGYRGIVQDMKYLTTNTLRFNREFNDVHAVNAMAGFSFETARRFDIDVDGTGFISDALPNVASASTPSTTSSTGTEWALWSMFAQAGYRYNNKYLFEASVRRDGSSRFGPDNKWGNFWAVSGGWILTEEDFLSDVSFIDFLKLSASYGTSGNDRIGNFDHLGLYGSSPAADGSVDSNYAGIPGIRPTQPANSSLGWEESNQLDITLNGTFLNNRLSVEASWYRKEVTDMLLNVPLPYTTGFASSTQNFGEMVNTGIDLSITSTNLDMNGFVWETTFNVGYLKNEVTKLPETTLDEDGNPFVAGTGAQRAVVGHSVNTFYLIRYEGINPDTGDAEWLTRDGEITTNPVAADRVIAGSALPKFSGGLTNKFTYKGITLNTFFTFVQGNKVLFDDFRFTDNPGNVTGFNLSTRLLDYWQQPGDNSYAPAMSSPTLFRFAQRSTQQLVDGSYIRLKNISLSYNLPTSILERTKVFKSARVYVMGQNLLTFTNSEFPDDAEPEINGSGSTAADQGESFFTTAQPKTMTIGISLGF